jgi:hypothetical protein
MKRRFAFVVPMLGLSVWAHAQRYVAINLEVEWATDPAGNTNAAAQAKPATISVTCITSTNEWQIEHDQFQSTSGDRDKWGLQKWSYDGTNVYNSLKSVSLFSTNVTVNIRSSADGCPLGDPIVNLAWLAFCSGPYLKRPGRLVPLPLDILHHTPDRFGYSDRSETFNDEFGLPRTVDLFTSKTLLPRSALEFHKEYFTNGRYDEYDKNLGTRVPDGILTFHYAVQQSTNVLGWTFPLRFECFQKGRSYIQNGDWAHRAVGTVKSIHLAEKPRGLFVSNLQQTIVDWRFRDLTNGVDAITCSPLNKWSRTRGVVDSPSAGMIGVIGCGCGDHHRLARGNVAFGRVDPFASIRQSVAFFDQDPVQAGDPNRHCFHFKIVTGHDPDRLAGLAGVAGQIDVVHAWRTQVIGFGHIEPAPALQLSGSLVSSLEFRVLRPHPLGIDDCQSEL